MIKTPRNDTIGSQSNPTPTPQEGKRTDPNPIKSPNPSPP